MRSRCIRGAITLLLPALVLIFPADARADGEASAWTRHPAPADQPLHRVFFLDDRLGWILTYGGGTVLHTRDGGDNWQIQARVAADYLEAIRFIDAEHGWMAGDYGTVFRSIDGGDTWQEISPPLAGRIEKRDDDPAWHLDDEMGGWFISYNKARFFDAHRAWVAGLLIEDTEQRSRSSIAFTTEDGGATWTRPEEPPAVNLADAWRHPPDDFGESFYLDAQHAWRLRGRGRDKELERTMDGGRSWQNLDLPDAEVWFWRDLAFTSAERGFLLGEIDRKLETGVLYETQDGGVTWQRAAVELPSPHDITVAPSKIWIVGKQGLLLSRDRNVHPPTEPSSSLSDSELPIRELDFFEEHPECEILYTVERSGDNQETARARVFESVAEAGGNAVVFHGAMMKRDPESGGLLSFTERALIHRCPPE